MQIDASAAPATREHKGTTYHFCSIWCAEKFDHDADAYVAASRLRGESDADNTDDPHP
jgi:YHS domain-containing protein